MIVERLRKCCKVAGTVWRRRGPSRDFFEGGRAYTSFRRALRRANDLIAMAIYHLHVKVIGRKSGSSAVASAAYRSASRLRDDRLERSHDFSAKRGVVHSEVMLPENAPEGVERPRTALERCRGVRGEARMRSSPARSNSPFRAR